MTPPSSLAYPTRTKILVVVVLTLAVIGFVLAGLTAETDGGDSVRVSGGPGESSEAEGVLAFAPRDGGQALAQDGFSIRLAPGWTGELTFLPGNGAAVALPEDEIQVSPLNELAYRPAEGKTVEELPRGVTSCVLATIWDQVRGREASERTEQWCFDVT
jgi:hypothetical protein